MYGSVRDSGRISSYPRPSVHALEEATGPYYQETRAVGRSSSYQGNIKHTTSTNALVSTSSMFDICY